MSRTHLILYLLSILSVSYARAQTVVQIGQPRFDITISPGDSLSIFEDLTTRLTISEIRKQKGLPREFTGTEEAAGVYWIRFRAVNRTAFDLVAVLEFDRTSLIDLWQFGPKGERFHAKSGGGRPLSQMHPGDDHNHIGLTLPVGEQQEFYMRFTNETDYLPDFSVRFVDTAGWHQEKESRHTRDFLMFGALLVMMIYAIALLIIHRHLPYFWLALHSLGLMMYSFTARDYLVNWFFPENPVIGVATPWAMLGVSALLMLVMNFLETGKHFRKWHRILVVLVGLSVTQMITSVIMIAGYGRFVLSTLISLFFLLLTVLLLVAMVLVIWKHLNRTQRVFGYGILFFISAVVFAVISWFLIDELGRTTATAVSAIAPLGQILIFAIALGIQMRQHEVDKNIALDELNATLKGQNKKIEQEVIDRTTEINQQKLQLENRNERIETLFREVHHRVKNNLQLISSLLNMQQEWSSTEDPAKAIEDSRSRVVAMSMIHQFLYRTDDIATIDFKEYAEELVNKLDAIQVQRVPYKLQLKFESNRTFDIDTSISLGLILNELVTNSYKHALLSQRKLELTIGLEAIGEGIFNLQYKDNGEAIKEPFAEVIKKGFGLRMASRLAKQLQGKMEYRYDNGNLFTISFADEEARIALSE
ncbi:MAG: hypothetical protein HEP71_30550 [Roseivirga sp.]|nr:hypothetical protein [Roseivirga sp.]